MGVHLVVLTENVLPATHRRITRWVVGTTAARQTLGYGVEVRVVEERDGIPVHRRCIEHPVCGGGGGEAIVSPAREHVANVHDERVLDVGGLHPLA